MKTIFLDSSVLFTAVNSPIGGSAKLFSVTQFKIKTSLLVLTEVERNVCQKLFSYHLLRFFSLVEQINLLDQVPDARLIQKAKKVIVEKDAVILAEAKRAKTDFLVTLDKKHFLTDKVRRFLKPQKPVTPKMLFVEIGI